MDNIPALIIAHAVVTTMLQFTLFTTHIPSKTNIYPAASPTPLSQEDIADCPELAKEESETFPIKLHF
jgi:hypothetical protein